MLLILLQICALGAGILTLGLLLIFGFLIIDFVFLMDADGCGICVLPVSR